MSQFDVFANPVTSARRAYPLVVCLQSDLIAGGADVVVAPLASRRSVPGTIGRLTPIIRIDEQDYVVLTNSLTSLPAKALQQRLANLSSYRQSLTAALDLLFFGI
jgi:toxin CcdB